MMATPSTSSNDIACPQVVDVAPPTGQWAKKLDTAGAKPQLMAFTPAASGKNNRASTAPSAQKGRSAFKLPRGEEPIVLEVELVDKGQGTLGSVIGKAGARIREVQETTGTLIEGPTKRGGQGAPHVFVIKGASDADCKNARELLLVPSLDPETASTARVDLEPSQIGGVIGKGGSNIRQIQAITNTSIKSVEEDGKAYFNVIGANAQKVERAKNMLLDALDSSRVKEERVDIAPEALGVLLNKNTEGGMNLINLSRETNTKIDVVRGDKPYIVITGRDAEGVQNAKTILDKATQVAFENRMREVRVEVPATSVGSIIGKGGANVREIEAATSCRIKHVSEPVSAFLILNKDVEALEKARVLLEAAIVAHSLKEEKIAVPGVYTQFMLDREEGLNLNNLQKETSTRIDVQRGAEETLFVISGRDQDGFDKATAKVKEVLAATKEKVDGMHFARVEVPAEYMGQVIGKGGANIKELEAKEGLRIKRSGDSFAISGSVKEDVDHAETTITELYKKAHENRMKEERVSVPSNCLSTLLNKNAEGGLNLSNISKETSTRIDVRRGDKPVFVITGRDAEGLAKAKSIVEAAAKEAAENQACSVRVDVPPEAVGMVIGKGGANIKEIESTTSCRVKHITEPTSAFQVTGKKDEDVTKATKMLSDIIESQRVKDARVVVPSTVIQIMLSKDEGINLGQLQKENNCRIDVRRDGVPEFIITGKDGTGVKKAKSVIEEMCTKAIEIRDACKENEARVVVTQDCVGAVIGKGGQNLKDIESFSNARLRFSDVGEKCFIISGRTLEIVKAAEERLSMLVAEVEEEKAQYRMQQEVVPIPSKFVGSILSRDPLVVDFRALQKETGTKIEFPPRNSPSPQFTINGRNVEGIAQAKATIEEALRKVMGDDGGEADAAEEEVAADGEEAAESAEASA